MSNPFVEELLLRKSLALRGFPFPVSYVNDAIGGIRPVDLIVLTAKTGVGKTEMLSLIASSAAKAGKQVFFCALESEKMEIERRLAFKEVASIFYQNRKDFPKTHRLEYTDWVWDRYPELEELNLHVAESVMPKVTEGIYFYSPTVSEFTRKDFTKVYEEVAKDCGLFLFDHIHYLSPLTDKESENQHIKNTVATLRDLINKHEVPVIAAAHIRKEDKRNSSVLPTIEDLHGSSEITKQANHVVSFGPCYSVPSKDDTQKMIEPPTGSTLCRILKTRTGRSGCDRYAALLKFSLEERIYSDTYVPYKTDKFSDKLFPMGLVEHEPWMMSAREPKL